MKTEQEIEALKNNWLDDPCWDIFDTEGFEDHKEELKNYQNDQTKKWRLAQLEQNINKAADLGVPVETYLKIKPLQMQADQSKKRAKDILVYYFKRVLPGFDSDQGAEIREIIDSIVDSAVAEFKIELLKQAGGNNGRN